MYCSESKGPQIIYEMVWSGCVASERKVTAVVGSATPRSPSSHSLSFSPFPSSPYHPSLPTFSCPSFLPIVSPLATSYIASQPFLSVFLLYLSSRCPCHVAPSSLYPLRFLLIIITYRSKYFSFCQFIDIIIDNRIKHE